MALSQQELSEIISAVLSSLQTNSKTVMDMSNIPSISDDDFIELNGGRRVSFRVLKQSISDLFTENFNNIHTEIAGHKIDRVLTEISEDNIGIDIVTREQTFHVDIPLATDKKAGLMSPEHVAALNDAQANVSQLRQWKNIVTGIGNVITDLGIEYNTTQATVNISLTSLTNGKTLVIKGPYLPAASEKNAGLMSAEFLKEYRNFTSDIKSSVSKASVLMFEDEEAYLAYVDSDKYDPDQLCGIYEEN